MIYRDVHDAPFPCPDLCFWNDTCNLDPCHAPSPDLGHVTANALFADVLCLYLCSPDLDHAAWYRAVTGNEIAT